MSDAHVHYLVARVRQALAEDARTAMLDVEVQLSAESLFLVGQVESGLRRDAAVRVAREVVPTGIVVVSKLWIASYEPPGAPEPL